MTVTRLAAGVPALFLHGGPGMSAALERQQFATTLPIHWWDQPRLSASSIEPFHQFVEAAKRRVQQLSNEYGGPIALLASSYGARLALELHHVIPESIGAVTISGGVLELKRAFLRFGKHLARRHSSPQLEHLVNQASMSDDLEALWALIGAITAIPDFTDEYWSESAQAQRAAMRALAAQGALVDPSTFQVIVSASVTIPPRPLPPDREHRVLVLIGSHDPYVEVDESEYWRFFWPTATVEVVDSGHFPHLELPPEVWMPRS